MKVVSLDVHAEASQLCAVTEDGEELLEMKLPTEAAALRTVIGGIAGPKRLVFEEGPLSGWLHDTLHDLVDEVVSSDPCRNALIALEENSNDERDARSLAKLSCMNAIRRVYIAPEPYRSLRGLVVHDERLQALVTAVKNRIKALCRRQGIRYRAGEMYPAAGRPAVLAAMATQATRRHMESLYRLLDALRRERVMTARAKKAVTRTMPEVERMQTTPGVGPIVAQTTVAFVVDPNRFTSRSKLSSYAGLGLGQGITNWKPVGKTKASMRGQRQFKRVLLLAAKAAVRGDNALARRYRARIEAGWEYDKAIRDAARHLLCILCAIWRTGKPYDDTKAGMPADTLRG